MEEKVNFEENASYVVLEIVNSLLSICEHEKLIFDAKETVNFILNQVDAISFSDTKIYGEINEIVAELSNICACGESSQQIQDEVNDLLNPSNQNLDVSDDKTDSKSSFRGALDPIQTPNDTVGIFPNETKNDETLSAKIVDYSSSDSSELWMEVDDVDEVDIATADGKIFSRSDIFDDSGPPASSIDLDTDIETASQSEVEVESEIETEIESEFDGNASIVVTLKDNVRKVIFSTDRSCPEKNVREQSSGIENFDDFVDSCVENKLITCEINTGGDQLLPDSYHVESNSDFDEKRNDGVVPVLDADVIFKLEATDEPFYETMKPSLSSEELKRSTGTDGKTRSLRLGLSKKQHIKPLHNYSFEPKN